jgi:hypothetical protein
MRSSLGWLKSVRGSVRVGLTCVLAALVVVPVCVWAAAPAWWAERGVLNPVATPDDYAVVNQGQVKHIAKQAYEEMKAKGAVDPVAAEVSTIPNDPSQILFATWEDVAPSADDYIAINTGQLKNVAKPFYDRLRQLGYASALLPAGSDYPWSGEVVNADDHALANIGQVKHLFSFIVPTPPADPNDTDGDALPDAWELNYWPANLSHGPLDDSDNDGATNLIEYLQGRSPIEGVVGDA